MLLIMGIVIFACKSNSCRSQMAEAWAHTWIQDQVQNLKLTLQEFQEEDEKGDFEDDEFVRRIRDHIHILENTIVASVALDSASVFKESPSLQKHSTNSSACPDTTLSGRNGCHKRKQVKSKAVEAMAKDGIDISTYQPKTISEILPRLKTDRNSGIGGPLDLNNQILENVVVEKEDDVHTKPVDKLIVLCSCGEEMKYELVRRSKSVEEWSIDAPTAASKAGEGDQAYHRVSFEIRKEVNILLGSLLGKPFS